MVHGSLLAVRRNEASATGRLVSKVLVVAGRVEERRAFCLLENMAAWVVVSGMWLWTQKAQYRRT